MQYRTLLGIMIAVVVWPWEATWAEYTSAEAINEAGRQRMLTQRIVKAYTQLGLGVADQRSEVELRYSLELFQSQLDRLYQLDNAPQIHERLGHIESVWSNFQDLATGAVTPQRAKALLVMSGVLLGECDRLVTLLEKQSNTRLGPLINRAGRQRMLSQRLAALYLLRSWGIDHPSIAPGIQETRLEFVRTLEQLNQYTLDNIEIAEQLTRIEQDWAWFEGALAAQDQGQYNLVVMDASEQLLQSLEYLTALYELAATQPAQ